MRTLTYLSLYTSSICRSLFFSSERAERRIALQIPQTRKKIDTELLRKKKLFVCYVMDVFEFKTQHIIHM